MGKGPIKSKCIWENLSVGRSNFPILYPIASMYWYKHNLLNSVECCFKKHSSSLNISFSIYIAFFYKYNYVTSSRHMFHHKPKNDKSDFSASSKATDCPGCLCSFLYHTLQEHRPVVPFVICFRIKLFQRLVWKAAGTSVLNIKYSPCLSKDYHHHFATLISFNLFNRFRDYPPPPLPPPTIKHFSFVIFA